MKHYLVHIIVAIISILIIIGVVLGWQKKTSNDEGPAPTTPSTSADSSVTVAMQYISSEDEIVTVQYKNDEAYVIGAGFDHVTLSRAEASDAGLTYTNGVGDELITKGNEVVLYRGGTETYSGTEAYDERSWELMIPPSCERYSDGCNICTKGGMCTMRACMTYQKPQCLDTEGVTVPPVSDATPKDLGAVSPASNTLQSQKWTWTETDYTDGKTVVPRRDGVFSLTFGTDGTLAIGTDCNRMSAPYTVSGNTISIGEIATTLMYCENSQESDFSEMVRAIEAYTITANGIEFTLANNAVMRTQ